MLGRRAALGLAALLLVLHALAYFYWTEDDAGISLRYSANLALGRGLVYNPGEPVEAISNLGYSLLLAPLLPVLPGSDPRVTLLVVAKLLGLAAALAGLLEVRRLSTSLGLGPGAGATALVLVAGSAPYAAWSVGGLETPWVAWATLGLAAAVSELAASSDRDPAVRRAAAAAAGLVWLRADGFVAPLAAALALAGLARRWRPAAIIAGATLAAWVALLGLRLACFGRAFPNPVAAKVDLLASLWAAPHTAQVYLLPFLRLLGGWAVVAALLVAAAGPGAPQGRPRRVLLATLGGLTGYVLAVGGDWMPLYRFLAPAVGPLVVLLAAGGGRLLGRIGLHPGWRLAGTRPRTALGLLALAGLFALGALLGRSSFKTRRATPLWYRNPSFAAREMVGFWRPAVDWLRAQLPPDALLVTSEAGFIPYLSDLRTIDSYGLATPAIAGLPRGQVERSSLGVLTRFVAGPPGDPAQSLVAALPASVVVLQERMVQQWNDGRTPARLFAGRFALAERTGPWAIYLPARPPADDSAGTAGGDR